MFQSNTQIQQAFLAAVKLLEKITIYPKLNELRLDKIIQRKKPKETNTKCTCDSDYDKVKTFPILFPLSASEDLTSLGKYNVLPFVYLISMNSSKAFPVVQVIEVPLVYKDLFFRNREKEDIDSKILPIGSSYIVTNIKIEKENLSEKLATIRKSILKHIFDLTNSESTIFFSVFTHLPNELIENDQTNYFQSNLNNLEKNNWSSCPEKMIPLKYNGKFFTFHLMSWCLTKSEI